MKVKFVKQQLEVGLSAEVPLAYSGPEQKYTLADHLATRATHVRFEKSSVEFDFGTSADLVRTPGRDRCYRLVSAMPDSALEEVEEQLTDAYSHYVALAEADASPRALPAPRKVAATVIQRVST